jgi:hypothetical protein
MGWLMLSIPRRYVHHVFGILQSGLTSALVSASASATLVTPDSFFSHWLSAWLLSWAMMVPIVVVAAPAIRRFSDFLTQDRSCRRRPEGPG